MRSLTQGYISDDPSRRLRIPSLNPPCQKTPPDKACPKAVRVVGGGLYARAREPVKQEFAGPRSAPTAHPDRWRAILRHRPTTGAQDPHQVVIARRTLPSASLIRQYLRSQSAPA